MKLILTIVQDQDADATVQALNDAGHRVTRVASTGGFFRVGNTTLLIGVDDEAVSGRVALENHLRAPHTPDPAGPNIVESAAMMGAFRRG